MVSLLLETKDRTATMTQSSQDHVASDLTRLPDDTSHNLANLFKLLADETRLRIIYFLFQSEEINVRTFCRLLGQSQPAVSHHLALLKEAGILESRRDGKHNFYHVVPKQLQTLVDLLFGGPPDQPRKFRLDDCVLTYQRDAVVAEPA